jgi:hypothetical protein
MDNVQKFNNLMRTINYAIERDVTPIEFAIQEELDFVVDFVNMKGSYTARQKLLRKYRKFVKESFASNETICGIPPLSEFLKRNL